MEAGTYANFPKEQDLTRT